MKIMGFSSGVVNRDSNTDRLVKAIMEKTGYESEFVKLTDMTYSACKGCVWLCAGPEVCMYEDEIMPHYKKVKEADAVVLGSPIHFATVNAAMLSFISRLWGFRHVNFSIANKPFVLITCGIGGWENRAEEDYRMWLRSFKVKIVDLVHYSSKIPPCYRCGRHQECRIGGAYRLWEEKACTLEIIPQLFNKWEDDLETVAKVEEAAEKIKEAVTGHRRSKK